jgi:hypothetical protein
MADGGVAFQPKEFSYNLQVLHFAKQHVARSSGAQRKSNHLER